MGGWLGLLEMGENERHTKWERYKETKLHYYSTRYLSSVNFGNLIGTAKLLGEKKDLYFFTSTSAAD